MAKHLFCVLDFGEVFATRGPKQYSGALSIDTAMAKLASSTTTTQTIAWQRPHQQRTLASSEWLSLKEAAKVRKNGSNKADVPRDVLLELELSRPLLALRKLVAEEAAAKGVVWALKAERSPSYL